MIMVAGSGHAGDRHGGACRSREVGAGPGADRDGARPVGRGTAPGADHRPGLRLDEAARRGAGGFVDVPGHERFVPNMLAALAPSPPCCSWWPPTAAGCRSPPSTWPPSTPWHQARPARRHPLRPGRSGPATRQALDVLSRTSLGAVEAVAVSAVTGPGCRNFGTRWPGWWRHCPRPIPPRRSGSGSTGRSASGAVAPS